MAKVAAVCALEARFTQLLVLAAALVSQVEFPFVYDRVATGSWPGVVARLYRSIPLCRGGIARRLWTECRVTPVRYPCLDYRCVRSAAVGRALRNLSSPAPAADTSRARCRRSG